MMDDKTKKMLLNIFKTELEDSLEILTSALLKIEKSNSTDRVQLCQELFRTSHNIKGAAKSVMIEDIAHIAHELEDQFSEWREKKYKPNKDEIDKSLQFIDQIKVRAEDLFSVDEISSEVLKIPIEKIEQANVNVDEFVTYKHRLEIILDDVNKLKSMLPDNNDSQINHHDLIRSIDIISDESKKFFNDFSRSLSTLQDCMRNMRLLPLDTVFSSMERTVRDLSKSLGKQVTFHIKGGETVIDKAILNLIKDPILHLIRNAIDHGIEDPVERKNKSKDEVAKIKVNAIHESGKIKITLEDDGRGINPEAIKNKAINLGVLTKESASLLSEAELIRLIFKPGFSTSDKLSEVSGRGVGLDVVMSNLTKVKGSIDIETNLNKGTKFILQLPLTLATTRGLFLSVSSQLFMIPSLMVKSLHYINMTELKPVGNSIIVVLNNQSIPVYPLRSLLGLHKGNEETDLLHGVEIGGHGESIILLVDKIEKEQDCVIKPLPIPVSKIDLYSGVTLTGSGGLVPVLDPSYIQFMASKFKYSDNSKLEKKNSLVTKKILVIDDSITARGLTANSLKSQGYLVDTCEDGLSGWESIKNNYYDCVITDINMPVMDGFELTKLVKSNDKYQKIPVIIISSCETNEEKKQGLDAGADAYLFKSQYSSKSLIELLKVIL